MIFANTCKVQCFSPVNAGDVNDNIYHVTAEFVGLHVDRGAVCGDVNLANNIEQEGFLNPRVLENMKEVDEKRCK